MPIYEFRCSSCDHVFEELIFRTTEIKDLVCPRCKATGIDKQMSTFASTGDASPCGDAAFAECGSGAPSAECGSGGFS